MTEDATIVLLFAIATGIAIAARHFRMPYTVALVAVGLALGATDLLHAPHLTRELLFTLFLPGLIFEAAFNLDITDLRRNAIAIGALAVPGVVVGTLMTGAIATAAFTTIVPGAHFTWAHGLVFGALVAATDPIAVVALFRQLAAPHRLRVLLEGESLVNDGTAIVVLTLILSYVSGQSTSLAALLLRFIAIVGGGAAIGLIVAGAIALVIRSIEDPMIEIALTTIAAYGSFIVAERCGVSGVIATLAAGVVCGSVGRRGGLSKAAEMATSTFWEYVAFALNSVIFLLIGFEARIGALGASVLPIVIALAAVIGGRAMIVLSVALLLRRSNEHIPRAWTVALTWGGLRGALSMVLALALPADLAQRSLLVTMTIGVVVGSILVQGLSMPLLLDRLGLSEQPSKNET